MTPPFLRLFPLALSLLCAGCRGDAASETIGGSPDGVTFVGGQGVVPEEYAVDGEVVDLSGRLTILANGFPVHKDGIYGTLRAGTSLRKRLTPALVSGENVAAYEVVPFLSRTADGVSARPVRFTMWVEAPDGSEVEGTRRGVAASDSAFARWERALGGRWAEWAAAEDSVLAARPGLLTALADSVASDPHAGAYGVGPALDSARAWAAANPVVVETHFVRSGAPTDIQPSFDAVFREAPVIAGTARDSSRLRAYAVRLRDLTADRDTAALWASFAPKYADEFAWWGGADGVGEDSASFLAGTRSRVVVGDLVPFEAADVRLRSWAGGRVWELYRDGADGLLARPSGMFREVYVGEVDGELRVVR